MLPALLYLPPMQKWLIILSLIAFSCKSNQQKAQAQEKPGEEKLRNLTEEEQRLYSAGFTYFMDTMLNTKGFSGGILVAKNGHILYEHYQGNSDASQSLPINDSTPFHVASTSKTFTGHAILQLLQQGKLQLTDTLGQFFPDFPYPGITVQHLLTHTSGLQNYAYFFEKMGWSKKQIATNRDVLDFMIAKKPPLAYPTGKRFNYCNTNFVLLALIVEELSGEAFPAYVQEHIFKPAGMNHSYVFSISDTGRYTPSFKGRSIYKFDYLDAIYGDKNVYTTCRDLMKYDAAIRNHVLLDSSTYALAWVPFQSDRHSSADTSEHYGLGWRLKVWSNGNKIVYHNGWWHGNNSVFQRLIQDTAVIIVTGNVYNRNIYKTPRAANFFRPYYDQINKVQVEEAAETTEPTVTTKEPAHTEKKAIIKMKQPAKKQIAVKAPAKKQPEKKPARKKS